MNCKATFLAGIALALSPLLAGCGKSGNSAASVPPTVVVSQPREEKVADHIDLTGTVAASLSVDLVARVSGYLQSVNFADGGQVETGQVLFVIEPAPYQAQLDLAQAALLRAQSEYDRQLLLVKSNATSVASVERWLSERDQAKAQVDLAKLDLSYTSVTAPFSGRIGRHLVDPGNLVGPGSGSKLATLDQLSPIYVYFSLNERDALRIRDAIRQRGLETKPEVGKAPVFVGLQNQEGYPYEGTLDFVNPAVSANSGTIEMRAVLKNEDKTLWPGLFARVRIPLGEPQPLLVVPNRALGNDQECDYVLVVGADNIVARRAVVKGPLTETGCALRRGLAPSDRVIVSGTMKARPGAKVTPTTEPSTPAR